MTHYPHVWKTPDQRGFSLIELLVSVALFSIVMTVSIGTLLVLINANQKAQSFKSVIDNLNFGIDSISRAVRTGRSYNCNNSVPATLPSGVRNCNNGRTALVFTDERGRRVAYRYNNAGEGSIERRIGNNSSWVALTASNVFIDDMLFYVTGTASADEVQPTVTISIRGHAGVKAATDSYFNIEMTIAQHVLDN